MRLCVVVPCFFRGTDFCDAIKEISKLGYDAAETYSWQGIATPEVKKVLDENNVELLSMCTTEFRLTDPKYRGLFLDGLERSAEAANILGVKRLITQVGQDTLDDRKAQHESILEGLFAAASMLEKYKVTLMIEPLNTYVDHPGYYLTSSSEAFDIVRKVNSPYVKAVYDIYHQQIMEGNIISSIINNLDCIAHLHGAGHPGRHEMQFGESDYKNIIKAVDSKGYKGALGLEYSPLLDPIESLKEAKKIYG